MGGFWFYSKVGHARSAQGFIFFVSDVSQWNEGLRCV